MHLTSFALTLIYMSLPKKYSLELTFAFPNGTQKNFVKNPQAFHINLTMIGLAFVRDLQFLSSPFPYDYLNR